MATRAAPQDERGDAHGNETRGRRSRPRSRSLRLAASLLAALHLCTACYTYVPPKTAPLPGAAIVLDLTDQGRIAHTAALGPGVLRVNGTLTAMEGDRYFLDVTAVQPIRGPELPVTGIQVRLAPQEVTDVRVRTFSKKRTAWVVGAALAVVVSFFVTKGFKTGYTPPDGPGGGGPDQYRGSGT
ncbi:MAG TPA: hypothetical protein VFV33_06120 [Gemmatimonadaceae bacterium]|nr:hypothetical protein [Gemmatimonadaceae bacterium]